MVVLKTCLIFIVHCYRLILGPITGGACRFHPSCSQYALEALATHSPGQALKLIVNRLARCRPFGGSGHDPVPRTRPTNFHSQYTQQRKDICR